VIADPEHGTAGHEFTAPRPRAIPVVRQGAALADTAQQAHERLNESLLQPLERPALRWLAAHMPTAVTPDHLTAIGVLGAFLGFVGYAASSYHPAFLWLTNFGLLVNWFGDSLDGTVARFRHIERPRYGYFLDKTTDLIADSFFALGLGLSPFVHFEVACLALIVYLQLSAFSFVKAHVSGTMQIAFGGVGPTEVRVVMAIFNFSLMIFPVRPIVTLWAPLTLADLCTLAVSLGGFLLFLVLLLNEARRLAIEEPSRGSGSGKP
jgi:archaetidylinositol phosphate synthase